jgi:acyl-CoA thioesterase I
MAASLARLAAALALCGALTAAQARADERNCSVPPEVLASDAKLPLLAERLKARQAVTIVAIGGSSTAGIAVPTPAQAYPERLRDALTRRYPGTPIQVINKGVPHQAAGEVFARFDKDVLAEKPDLTIWETGTIEAVRGLDIDAFTATLEDGLAALHQHHIEAILVNMQYSRRTASIIDFEPYVNAMRRLADLNEVYLFPRLEIMRFWSDNGTFDFEDVPKADRAALAASVYDCLARQLAEAIGLATQ